MSLSVPAFVPSSSTRTPQQRLAAFNAMRLAPAMPGTSRWDEHLVEEIRLRREEHRFIERLRCAAARHLPRPQSPAWRSADAFVTWFESLEQHGPGQHHPWFDWLAAAAAADDMSWFLAQEVAGEAGFEDLLAYAQVRLPVRAKLELARNYWDEMGRGKPRAMHGPLLQRMARELRLAQQHHVVVEEALALGNLMAGLALNRRYAFHAIGALGVIELTAPGRARQVVAGMRRLGMGPAVRAYYELHAAIDPLHSQAWNREVIAPLVEGDAERARAIAEGALMRLLAGQHCFERYRRLRAVAARAA